MHAHDDEEEGDEGSQRQRLLQGHDPEGEEEQDEEEVALLLSTFDRCRPRADGTVDARCVGCVCGLWVCVGGRQRGGRGDDGDDTERAIHRPRTPSHG